MEMTGEFRIPAPRQRVWEGLNDPEVLKQCIPGCQTLEKVSDTEFNGKVVAAVGPVRATFGGKVMLSDLNPPRSYTISGEGSGGVAGFAKGGAKVNLVEDGAATVLTYAVQAQVGGKLAQVGSRLIDGVARKMASDFFGHFAAVMAPEQPVPAAAAVMGPEQPASAPAMMGESDSSPKPPVAELEPLTAEPPLSAPPPKPGGIRLSPAVWVTGLVVIIILLLYFFTRQ